MGKYLLPTIIILLIAISITVGVTSTIKVQSRFIDYIPNLGGPTNISKNVFSIPKNIPRGAVRINSSRDLEEVLSRVEVARLLSYVASTLRYGYIAPIRIPPTPIPTITTVPLVTPVLRFEAKVAEFVKAPYSKTNIQVPGVDEADIVKTDGTYIYLTNGRKVYIVKAYPPTDMHVVTKLSFSSHDYVRGLYIYRGRLIVILEHREPIPLTITKPKSLTTTRTVTIEVIESWREREITKTLTIPRVEVEIVPPIIPPVTIRPIITKVLIYNFTGKSLVPIKTIEINGTYVTSRLINNYLYLITQYPLVRIHRYVVLPKVNGVEPPLNTILFFNIPDLDYRFTTILALNIQSLRYKTHIFLLGSSSYVYVSTRNIYVLCREYSGFRYIAPIVTLEKLITILPEELRVKAKDLIKNLKEGKYTYEVVDKLHRFLSDVALWFNKQPLKVRKNLLEKFISKQVYTNVSIDRTRIFRFRIEGLEVRAEAQGVIPGQIYDQFSMDEYGDYFRIATTSTRYIVKDGRVSVVRSNNVYVLNMNLSIVGKLEGIAPGERIYAARYLGNIMYLVTYRRVDPLFGIDLSNPKEPKVIGFLKIPGYSEYLHILSTKYLLGIGISGGTRGRYVKVSLYDISNPRNITEVSYVVIKGAYWSPLFTDHKAFLINPIESYIAFPIYGKIYGLSIINYDLTRGMLSIKGIINLRSCVRGLYLTPIFEPNFYLA